MNMSLIKREFKAGSKVIFIVIIGLILFIIAGYTKFSATENTGSLDAIMSMMPKIISVMMGAGSLSLDTPQGFYCCMFLWVSLLIYTHAALLGASILSKEQRDKTSEFLFTKPITRTTVLSSKFFVCVVFLGLIALVSCVATLIVFLPLAKGLDLQKQIIETHIGLFFTQLVYFFAGVCFSTFLKNHKQGSLFATLFLFYGYFSSVFIELSEVFQLNFLSPFRYFYGPDVFQKGLTIAPVLGAFALISIFLFFSYKNYQKKDL